MDASFGKGFHPGKGEGFMVSVLLSAYQISIPNSA
jgi:hypothetical protein